MSEELSEQAWLLKSKVNPFPVAGTLALHDGRLSYTLGELAGEAVLAWVEEATGETNLAERLKSGEQVVLFDHAAGDLETSWPKLYGGSWLEVKDPQGRTWIIAMDYPSGGSISQTMSIFSGRKKGKVWKQALAGA